MFSLFLTITLGDNYHYSQDCQIETNKQTKMKTRENVSTKTSISQCWSMFFFFLSFSRTCYELSIAVGAEGEAGRKQNLYVRGAGGH